ncbi:MAG: CCA tRNA nucleotidyltransferase [Pseudomonadota bacterium]
MIDAPFLRLKETRQVFEAFPTEHLYFVGGCVRNQLLGVEVSDLDLSTDLHPKDVLIAAERAGIRAIPTGIDHGTVTLVVGRVTFEVTTFRRDVETDGRRAVVAFADRLEDDAQRRDFTMNALYLDGSGKLFDPTNGIEDLKAGRVRFIGNASERIKEDALRILRFFRFHAWYGRGEMDAHGVSASQKDVDLIDTLSRERVGAEMLRLLGAPDPTDVVTEMDRIGALGRVVPGASLRAFRDGAIWSDDPLYRLALLQGDGEDAALRLSKAQAQALRRIKSAASSRDSVASLGYRLGVDEGMSAALLRSAFAARMPSVTLQEEVTFGAGQTFTLVANDLMDAVSGPALGQALRDAEALWIESGFEFTADELRAKVLADHAKLSD